MKNKEFQHLKAHKFSTLFVALAFGALVFFNPGVLNLRSSDQKVAEDQASRLAQEILQRRMLIQKGDSREPASAQDMESNGQIGMDPWGQPYKYNVLETDMGTARVVVRTQSGKDREIQGYAEAPAQPADAQDLKPEY